MPVQDRRFYIFKHNEEQEKRKYEYTTNQTGYRENGDLNAFAKTEQSNINKEKRR